MFLFIYFAFIVYCSIILMQWQFVNLSCIYDQTYVCLLHMCAPRSPFSFFPPPPPCPVPLFWLVHFPFIYFPSVFTLPCNYISSFLTQHFEINTHLYTMCIVPLQPPSPLFKMHIYIKSLCQALALKDSYVFNFQKVLIHLTIF